MAKKRRSYGSQVAAVAPAFALKSLIGDLPKGALEKTVELKAGGSQKPLKKIFSEGLKGRGAGRAMGAGLGISTAPLYLGGLALLNSKDKKDKAKGLAMVGAAAGVYQSAKGFTEAYREARVANASKAKSALEGLRLGTIRLGYKTPAALAMGLSIAAGRKKRGNKKASKMQKIVIPALAGALIGAASRGGEGAIKDLMKGRSKSRILGSLKPRMLGGAAGGLVGGAVLGGVIDAAMKTLEKKGSVSDIIKEAEVVAERVMEKQAMTPSMVGAKVVADLVGIHALTKGAFGYGRLGQTVGRSKAGRFFQKKTSLAKQKQLAIGIREGIAGRVGVGARSQIAMNAGIPELKMQRLMGISIGGILRKLPPEARVSALEGASKFIRNTPAMRKTIRGESISVLDDLPGAVDMALGRKKLPGNKAINSLIYGGRGGLGKGLPKPGRQDSRSALSAENLANVGTGAAGLAGIGAVASGAAPALALIPASHLAMSGIKNLVTKTKAFKNLGKSEGARGIREALIPGIRKTYGLKQKAKDKFVDYVVSPGARDYSRLVGGVVAGGLQRGRREVQGMALQKYINRAAGANKKPFKDYAIPSASAGAGLGAILNIRADRKARKKQKG